MTGKDKFYSLFSMKPFYFLISLASFSALALETDNYLAWTKELKDSSEKINYFLKTEINRTLSRINNNPDPQSCIAVTRKLAASFKAFLVHENPIEKWLLKNLDHEEFYPHSLFYLEESIYRNPYRFYLPKFGLAPNVSVNGVNLGIDKLTHWSSTGRHYFNIFVSEKKLGSSDFEATLSAINYGILDELTLHGFWASGVFSFADLEANYQGLLFYKRLCYDKNDSYLKQTKSMKWILNKSPKIEDYVNPDWDETYNLSYLEPKNWEKVSSVIREEYCPWWSSRKTYEYRKKSLSSNYINTLSRNQQKNVPLRNQQDPDKLCQE